MITSFGVPFHSGTDAGASISMLPSATRMPIAAWVIDFAMLHEMSVESASSSTAGWKSFAGWVP